MIVRQATAADAGGIAQITNQIIRDTLITFTTAEKPADQIASEIAQKGARFQVAEEAGTLLGYVSLGAFRAGPGYARTCEHTIYLAETARGRGAGRALIAAIEDVARAEGIHVLVAGISAVNTGGLAFHAAMGFDEVGRLPQVGRKAGRWLDLVLMQKILTVEADAAPDSAAQTG
ncbi:GNAT family N-acetyltransferase [Phaeobacter sp. QD34_3]|uniref:GNAT family N-acetyltransferase n=1 Tax=unclassified Phaeobacter TaxID=2621772 RepID=UPI00237F04A6|nr:MULTISPECIES: GNAT family N-acetyltransferase [unclassified Phaeobacter]MDE4131950.1 GNAT family N-acetyltransferase [Phaeobacter sp. QD34_3]MDE4135588.1 GNAT family N-acetyltransferase [Phaeobacter sp. QD34_24]MDE4173577.1 GNAT family N-acetyltransferase [Phaeobacter sp. PT47_59]